MRRRRLLAALGGGASLGLGGLLTYRASQTRTLSITSVETYDAALRIDDDDDDLEVRDVESLEPSVETALRSAVDSGEYTTSDPSVRVSNFLDRERYVRAGDQLYRLSDTFPGVVITAEAVESEPASLDVATSETFLSVVREHGHEQFIASARHGGVVDRAPDPDLRNFFEQYDAARVGTQLFRFSASSRETSAPYSITAEPVSRAEVEDAMSLPVEELPRAVRERVRDVPLEESTVIGLSDPSAELRQSLFGNEFLVVDGVRRRMAAWSLAAVPLSIDATVTEAGMGFKDPARLRLTLANTSERALPFHGSAANPFGTLRYRPVGGGRARYLYAASAPSRSVWSSTRSYVEPPDEEIPAGESLTAGFAVGGDAVGVPRGRYEVSDTLGGFHAFYGREFPFRITFEVD